MTQKNERILLSVILDKLHQIANHMEGYKEIENDSELHEDNKRFWRGYYFGMIEKIKDDIILEIKE